MTNLRIKPIQVGSIYADKSAQTYMCNYGEKIQLPIFMWYIEGAKKNILVDTGPCHPERANRFHWPMTQTPEQEPGVALKVAGIEPENIEIVIFSHLHWDHAFNNYLFPNAEFIVQEAELRYAIYPLPIHAPGYEATSVGLKPDYYTQTKYNIINGDKEIVPGVSVILTPGHTPGSQCVVVDTEKGKYVIAVDTVPLFENWAGSAVLRHIPNTIHVGLVEYFESFNKIERIADFVLPGHDMNVLEHEWYPY